MGLMPWEVMRVIRAGFPYMAGIRSAQSVFVLPLSAISVTMMQTF